MTEELVCFETAKLAKKKGFNEETFCYYNSNGLCFEKIKESNYTEEHRFDYLDFLEDWNSKVYNTGYIAIPTQSLLQRWLREKYNIHIMVCPKMLPDNTVHYYLYKGKIKKDFNNLFSTYEQALEQGLLDALNLLEDV